MKIDANILSKITVRLEPDQVVEAGDLELYSQGTAIDFELDAPRPGLIGLAAGDSRVVRPVVNKLDMLDMLGSKKCVCGLTKERQRSHCRECYFSLTSDQRQALYRRFGKGYEPAFLDSLATLIDQGRTDLDKIRNAVPRMKRGATNA